MRIFDSANSRPQCHPFQKGGAVVSQVVPGPVSPVSKRWRSSIAPSSRPQCHLFQKGGALMSHLLPGPTVTRFKKVERSPHTFFATDSRAPLQASLPLPSAFSLVSRAGTAAKDEPEDLKRTDLFKQEEEDLEEQRLCLWML